MLGWAVLSQGILGGCNLELAGAAVSENLKTGTGGSHGRQLGAGCLLSFHVGLSTGLCGSHDLQLVLSRVSDTGD